MAGIPVRFASQLLRFCQIPLIRVCCRLGAIRCAGLTKNVGDVLRGGVRCDHQLVRYLLVRAPGGQKAQHFHIASCEAVEVPDEGLPGSQDVIDWLATPAVSLELTSAGASSPPQADRTSIAIRTNPIAAMFDNERSLAVTVHLHVCCD